MFYAIAFLLCATVALCVAAPLFRERRAWVGMPLHTRRTTLIEERDAALRELKDLEFDRRMGKIDDADYAELQAATASRATKVLDALEALSPTPRSRNGAGRYALEAEAEILVARVRLQRQGKASVVSDSRSPQTVAPSEKAVEQAADTWKCTCGRIMSNQDKFCASCGVARSQV